MTKEKEEQALITEIRAAVEKHFVREQASSNETYLYFAPESTADFQALALKTAELIKKNGPFQTSTRLLSAARELKKAGRTGWTDANSLGGAFRKALHPAYIPATAKKPDNPFLGMNI